MSRADRVSKSNARARRWERVTNALDAVPRSWWWIAWRWVLKQEDDRHQPQGIQVETKRDARRVAQRIIEALGGDLFRRAPKRIEDDPKWRKLVDAMGRLEDPARRGCLQWYIVERLIPETHPNRQRIYDDMRVYRSLVVDMVKQQAANNARWKIGVGYQRRRQRRRRKR